MKKRKILAAITAAVMTLGLMTFQVLAEGANLATLTVGETEKTYTTDQFAEFWNAFTSADEAKVKLESDFKLPIEQYLEIRENQKVELNFNGNKIIKSDRGACLDVAAGAELTLCGEGGIDSYRNCITSNANAKVIVNGGHYTTKDKTGGTALYNDGGEFTINAGTVNATSFAAYNENNGTYNINGGTIVSTSNNTEGNYCYCVKNASGIMNIYDGAVIKGIQGALAGSGAGTTNVYGGNIETYETAETVGVSFYACYAANTAKVNIYGGNFTAAKRAAIYVGNEDTGKDGAAVIIKGGTFKSNGGNNAAVIQANIVGNLAIEGGSFSSDVSQYVTNGMALENNGMFDIYKSAGTAVEWANEANDEAVKAAMEAVGIVPEAGTSYRVDSLEADSVDTNRAVVSYKLKKGEETKTYNMKFDIPNVSGNLKLGVIMYNIGDDITVDTPAMYLK